MLLVFVGELGRYKKLYSLLALRTAERQGYEWAYDEANDKRQQSFDEKQPEPPRFPSDSAQLQDTCSQQRRDDTGNLQAQLAWISSIGLKGLRHTFREDQKNASRVANSLVL